MATQDKEYKLNEISLEKSLNQNQQEQQGMTVNHRAGGESDSQNCGIVLLKMSSSQQKITKKQESMSLTKQKQNQSIKTVPEEPTRQRL